MHIPNDFSSIREMRLRGGAPQDLGYPRPRLPKPKTKTHRCMQIVVRNGHLASSGPKPGHLGVCVGMGPHGRPLGPPGGPGPSPGPRQPDSLVSGPFWLLIDAKRGPGGQ